MTDLIQPTGGDVQTGYPGVPRTAEELAALEASYQPFQGVASWRRLHVDEPRWARYARVLTRRVNQAGEQAWADTQDRLVRAATLESAALDGLFPANPELISTVLDGAIREPESSDEMTEAIELIAECHRRALILAGEAAADSRVIDINLMAVLQDVITESQATYTVTTEQGVNVEVELPRRQYKPVSNYLVLPGGGLAVFTPAGRVAAEMARLADELSSPDFAVLHPAVQAAYAHYALTAIHPFADGNGRLARTVASIFLMPSTGLPFLVFADQWPSYYQALKNATQNQDAQSLVDYFAATAITAMDFAANMLARAAIGLPGAGRASRTRSRRRPPRTALDEGARRLLDALAVELREVLVSPPRGVRLAIAQTRAIPADHIESAYRIVPAEKAGRVGIRVAVRVDESTAARTEPIAIDLEFIALASELPHDLLPLALREIQSKELLEVPLADAYPLVLEPTALRIRLWAQRLLTEALAPILPAAAERSRARRQPSQVERLR